MLWDVGQLERCCGVKVYNHIRRTKKKLFQSSLTIVGILCVVIWVGYGNDDDDDAVDDNSDGDVIIGAPPPPPTKIVFVSDREDNNEIFIMDADGANVINLTKNEAADSSLNWSPNLTKIAFISNREDNEDGSENREIYVMNTEGTNQ